MRRRTVVAAAALVAVGVAAGATATLASAGTGDVREQQISVPGTPEPGPGGASEAVSLDASLFLPAGSRAAPAVVLAHGFGGSKTDLHDDAVRLAQHGFVVLTYTARGFGRSRRADPSGLPGLRGRRRPSHGGRARASARGDPGRPGRPSGRGRRRLVRGCPHPDARRHGPSGRRDRAQHHLERPAPGPLPPVRAVVLGRLGCGGVPGAGGPDDDSRSLQEGVGRGVLRFGDRPGRGVASPRPEPSPDVGRRCRLRPVRARRLPGLPGSGDHRTSDAADARPAGRFQPRAGAERGQGADAAGAGRGRLAVPAVGGRRERRRHRRQRPPPGGQGRLVRRRPRRRGRRDGPAACADLRLVRPLPLARRHGDGLTVRGHRPGGGPLVHRHQPGSADPHVGG